jgi:hypothetical protein
MDKIKEEISKKTICVLQEDEKSYKRAIYIIELYNIFEKESVQFKNYLAKLNELKKPTFKEWSKSLFIEVGGYYLSKKTHKHHDINELIKIYDIVA